MPTQRPEAALLALLLPLLLSSACDPVRSSGISGDDDDDATADDDDATADDDDLFPDDDDATADDDDLFPDDDDDTWNDPDYDGDGWPWSQDCDDYDPTVFPGAPEVCNGRDDNCDGWLADDELDNDFDGAWPCTGDCDDWNAAVNPWAAEVCDGVDNDCDGIPLPGELDADGDGWFLCDDDCDDTDPTIHPSAPDPCEDGIDQNCDGQDPVCGACDPTTEVDYGGRCYYLDGSGGVCDPGYELARQGVLAAMAPSFVGRTYRHRVSDNCCVAHAVQALESQDWGMETDDCNTPGPFTLGPVLGGSACNDALNAYPAQLTFCRSL